MTTAAICATREVFEHPSYYRGEQYDSDLALYYLRARYYNPATGRFMSRDPKEYTPLKWTGDPLNSTGNPPLDSKRLHKYLYAGGDPVNAIDPTGRDWEGFAILVEDVAVVVASKAFAQVFCGGVVGYVFYEIADALNSKIALAATAAAAGGAGAACGLIP